jgi:hypothetical protein
MRENDRWTGTAAMVAAVVATVLAPLHALARFATEGGKEDLEMGLVRAWAEPAAEVLRPLIAWSDADTVYLTYGKLWAPLILVATLCAVAVRRRRAPYGAENWGWRLALTGYTWAAVGVGVSYWTPLLEEGFGFTLVGMLIAFIGSGVLGVTLLRRRFRSVVTPVLLVAWFPLFPVLSSVIAMGAAVLPMLWAWALAGRHLTDQPVSVDDGVAATA